MEIVLENISYKYKDQWQSEERYALENINLTLQKGEYVAIIGLKKFLDVQFEKAARCKIDYDKEGLPRKNTRYVSHIMAQK